MEKRDYLLNPNQFEFSIFCVDRDGTILPIMSWKFDCPVGEKLQLWNLNKQLQEKILFYMKEKTKDSLWSNYQVSSSEGLMMGFELIDHAAKNLETRVLLSERFAPKNVNVNIYLDKGRRVASISFDKIWRNFNCFFSPEARDKNANSDLSDFDNIRTEYYQQKRALAENSFPNAELKDFVFEGLANCIKRHLVGTQKRQPQRR